MSETETKEVKKTPGVIAVVEMYAGPGERRPVEFIEAPTKREMQQTLADPRIATVLGLFRGRRLQFQECRKVSF